MAMRILLLAIALLVAFGAPQSAPAGTPRRKPATPTPDETVFLLHGICDTKATMMPMEMGLKRRGFRVVNWNYASRKDDIDGLADQLAGQIARHPSKRISFVTHSMGEIVVRAYRNQYQPETVASLVMIAPPNNGSALADKFSDLRLYKLIFGPAGPQLRQGAAGGCAGAGVPSCRFGIIAGGRSRSRGMNPMIPGDNDGVVSVDSTRLPGASDFIVLPYPHQVIQTMPATIRHCVRFLRDGQFGPQPIGIMAARTATR